MDKPEILITATEASRSFSELLHRVCYGGESFVIKKGNRLMARITPVDAAAQPQQAAPTPEAAENPVPEAAESPASLPREIVPNLPVQELTRDEAEYYKTVIEQLRKPVFEPCD
jgi:antitoxin (DNA-binding transcriptional repressor) of toxin-antitoxin stability system